MSARIPDELGPYTVGQVAGLLGLAPGTVVKLFRLGELGGFCLPSGDRRVSRASLVAYPRSRPDILGSLSPGRVLGGMAGVVADARVEVC